MQASEVPAILAKATPIVAIVVLGILLGLGKISPEEFARFLGGGVLGFVGGLFTQPPGQQPPANPG